MLCVFQGRDAPEEESRIGHPAFVSQCCSHGPRVLRWIMCVDGKRGMKFGFCWEMGNFRGYLVATSYSMEAPYLTEMELKYGYEVVESGWI